MAARPQRPSATSRSLRAAIAASIVIVGGCTFNWMPLEPPAPRTFVLRDLRLECLASKGAAVLPELIEPGAAPRQKLRFHTPAEVESQLQLLQAPGFTSAPLWLETQWEGAGRSGVTCHRFELHGGLDPEDDPDDPIVGMLGLSPLGALRLWTDGLDPTSQRVEAALNARLAWIEPMLPAEPVGVGGSWRYRDEGWLRGDRIAVETHYRLLELAGARVLLRAERRVTRAPAPSKAGRAAQPAKAIRERRLAMIDVDLRRRFLPSARVFDESGREVDRILPAFR